MLESIRYVDKVIIFEEDTPLRLIEEIKPDIIVKGGDYKPEDVVGNEIAEVVICPLMKIEGQKVSTTARTIPYTICDHL